MKHFPYRFVACLSLALVGTVAGMAQQGVRYTGTTLADPNRHDGGLSPVVGVHNIQILRANREHPSEANGWGWTYNHQPMMAYWHGKFYVHYLSDVSDEQVPPSRTMLQTSVDGYHWSNPQILFPEYNVPEGFTKPGVEGVAHNMKAVMHQRQGFYTSSEGRLFALGSYGVCLNKKDHNNDGNGIGRVIREIKDDGKLGPIYFIYYNHGFGPKNTDYPNYKRGDRHVRKACEEILSNPRMLMGWVEEADRGDKLLPLNKEYKAYNDYTLPDGRVVALWKYALTSISTDQGHTWSQPVERAPGFVTANAKIWGQRLSDGTYATVYNPAEFRWPLAISLSTDGLNYTTLNLVNGEVPALRYGGNYKSRGPQYVRGIQEGNGEPKDSNLWLTYSMNKEDMWVSRIPVPVLTKATAQADEDFSQYGSLADLTTWNLYMPLMAPITLNKEWLQLSDTDPFDAAVAERMIVPTKELTVDFDVQAAQNDHGMLEINFLDDHGTCATRITLTPEGSIEAKSGARQAKIGQYNANETHHLSLRLSVAERMVWFTVDGKEKGKRNFFAPVKAISRIQFRTGHAPVEPTVDTPADWYGILDGAGNTDTLATFSIARLHTASIEADAGNAILRADDYQHYVDHFNTMEDENIVQAIPNSQSWQWMKANIPFFDAPDENFKEIWYYRWWTFRKHIRKAGPTWAITEFLVNRSYADRYNLISSALGHHIHEGRWLHDPQYLDGDLWTWFHGQDGKPLKKLSAYSQWTAASLWDRYLVDGRRDSLVAYLPSLLAENANWNDHRWLQKGSDGRTQATLYWQYDVRDAMEETISGGRREKNARPSINSYMYGNDLAIAHTAALAGDAATEKLYLQKADTLKKLVEQRLWNADHQFFEVTKPVKAADGTVASDTSSQVREAIGFLPWYFRLPSDTPQFAQAWLQAADPKGFSAPFGLTTAEQRHPRFRSHGTGTCEWDGAIWPFASSQTLTALANFANDYQNHPALKLDSLYFSQLSKYVTSQYFHGKPYIGEYQDEKTGYWLMGEANRSRYYNHSTFADLIITGLVGLRPRQDNVVEVRPLLPEGTWDYFCLDNVAYHGHRLTIVWDHTGSRYHVGQGLMLLVDGKLNAHRSTLGELKGTLPSSNR